MRFRHPYLLLFSTSVRHARGRRGMMVLTYAFFIIANCISMSEPFVLGMVFNAIQQGGDDLVPRATKLLALYGSLSFFFWIFHGTARLWEKRTAFEVQRHFRETLFGMVTDLPMRLQREHHSGDTIDRIQKATAALNQFASSGFQHITTAVKCIVSVGMILRFMPVYGTFALVMGGVILLILRKFDRAVAHNKSLINEREHALASTTFDFLGNIRTIIALRLQDSARAQHHQAIGRIFPFFKKDIRLTEAKWFSINMLVSFTTFALMLIYIVDTVGKGDVLLIGSVTALYGYFMRFSDAFFNMASQWETVIWNATNLRAADPIVAAHAQADLSSRHDRRRHAWNTIRIDGLRFSYEDDRHRRRHVEDISLTLERGKKIALVGESGSGKSTLLTLLSGLETPRAASISIDGEIDSDFGRLASMTTLLPQDPEIFESTIAFNIAMNPSYDEAALMSACASARFDPVLQRLSSGLLTDIKEKGVNLSGGEKQRLALARGIFAAQQSDIILMDEPTSSVDGGNELLIYRNIFERFNDRCIVSSIHRLHLLPMFDVIHVLSQGRTVETGTFDELIAKGGALKTMWDRYVGDTRKTDIRHNDNIVHSYGAHIIAPLAAPAPVASRGGGAA